MEPEQPGPKRPFDRLKVWRNQRHVPSEEETRRLLGQVAQTGKPSEVDERDAVCRGMRCGAGF